MTAILFGIFCASLVSVGMAIVSSEIGKDTQTDVLLTIGFAGTAFSAGAYVHLILFP